MIVGGAGLYGAKRWADFKANLRNEGATQCQLAATAAEVEALRAAQADLVARLSASQEREAAVLRERDEARSASFEAQARIADLSRGLQTTIPDAIVDIINRPVRSGRALNLERAP
jgi:septum formation inhibitor MinC